jgi:hypothetical protein
MAYDELEPFGHRADDFYHARSAFYLYQSLDGKQREFREFTWDGMLNPIAEPDWDDPEQIQKLLGG